MTRDTNKYTRDLDVSECVDSIVVDVTKKHKSSKKKSKQIDIDIRVANINIKKIKDKMFNDSNMNNTIVNNDVRIFKFLVFDERALTFFSFYTINILVSYNDNKIMNKMTIFRIFNYSKFNEISIEKFNEIAKHRNVIKYERMTHLQCASSKSTSKQEFNDDEN